MTQLSAFLSVVRLGSVTAAAEHLVVTQPSVSAAVAALERELGVQLTERSGRGVRPTAAGEVYARYAEDVLGLLREGAESAERAAAGDGGRLRISAVTTAGEHLLPVLISSFGELHPELELSVRIGNRREVFRRLESREADVAISGRAPEGAAFDGLPFLENEFVMITAPGDPLAQRPRVEVEELAGIPWLMREPGSGTRRLCEVYLASNQLQPPLVTLGSNGAIKNAARMGLGISLQSREAVELELEFGLLGAIRPRGGLPERSWHVFTSSVGPRSAPAEAFREYVTSPAARQALARAHGEEIRQARRRLADRGRRAPTRAGRSRPR
jgi:DNA-binding transcriptional LysR family regulator